MQILKKNATIIQILFSSRPSKAARKAAHQKKCDSDFKIYLAAKADGERTPKIKDSMLAKNARKAELAETKRLAELRSTSRILVGQKSSVRFVRSLADI